MAFSASKIGQLSFAEQSAWGTPATSGFTGIECEMPSFDFPTSIETPDNLRSNYFDPAPLQGHNAGGTLSFKFRMQGLHSDGATLTANPTANADAKLMKLALGGQVIGGYDDPGLGTTQTTTQWNATDGALHPAGSGIIAGKDYSGTVIYGFGVVKSVSTNALTLLYPSQVAPDDSSKTFGTVTSFSSNAQPAAATFRWAGAQQGQYFEISDAACTSATIETEPGGWLSCTMEFTCGRWTHNTSGAVAGVTATTQYLPVCIGYQGASLGYHVQGGTASVQESKVGSVSFSIENEYAPISKFNGSQGIDQYALTNRSYTMASTISYESWNALDLASVTGSVSAAAAYETVRFEVGGTPGNMLAIVMPRVYYSKFTPEDVNGIMGISWEAKALQHTADDGNASTTSAADSAFRLIMA